MQSGALGLSSDRVAPNCGISGDKSLTSVQVIFEASFLDIKKKESEAMKLFARKFFALAAVVIFSGCASITRGTSESFVIETVPAGANVTLSTGLTCTSPCSLKVKRRGDFVVTIKKDGYETITSTVTSSIDGGGGAAMAGNVLVGGIIGAGIDAGTGAMHSHKPNPLVVTLNPEAD